MANGPGLSTAKGGEVYVGSEVREALALLDVLYANHFEGQRFAPELIKQTEGNFYRGAPPLWLNFHISEQAESDGAGTPLIKRDGYDTLIQQIQQSRKYPGISTVKLFHQPGCGGTTLAMQVLWDLRKTFRCAVLKGSTSDMTSVAKAVVQLFTAGSRDLQNTVLLLLNDEQILDNLQDRIMEEIEAHVTVSHMPVVVLFCCLRKNTVLEDNHIVLGKSLSDTEMQKFCEKKNELSQQYPDQHQQFHGFNILQTNFSQDYAREVSTVFTKALKAKRNLKLKLAAFLALLNTYVPGSYLVESQCLEFLKQKDSSHEGLSMEPFSHLIVTFIRNTSGEKRVRLAHPMIAQSCTELMAEEGVTRSDTVRNFINHFCKEEVPPHLLGFIKDMLTKREEKKGDTLVDSTEVTEEKERFSRLILDVKETEGKVQCTSVLKVASNKFDQNPLFPQALARFYYIELQNYNLAEIWAKTAKQIDPRSSFIADTLGQVHKNHLKSKEAPSKPREILQLATKAIEAFKDEEQLAEKEYEATRNKKGSHVHNTRGQFGYLQVCNILYNVLVSQDETWRKVLTNKAPVASVLDSLGDKKLIRYNGLIKTFRDEVERKYKFFDTFLTYSKPSRRKHDAPYILKDISDCCRKYVEDVEAKCDVKQKLKEYLADTSTGVISCLDRECTKHELKETSACWEKVYASKGPLTALVNHIFAHIMLINTGERFLPTFSIQYLHTFKQEIPLSPQEAPELHLLALILCWPTDAADKWALNLGQLVQRMRDSYECSYKKQIGSRYLRPLFFIGKSHGLKRVIHRKVLEGMCLGLKDTKPDCSTDWNDEKMFQDPTIQGNLFKFEGVVQNYRVYATLDGTELEVDANVRNNLWKPRQVSFNLGFTIRGPVAFGIHTKTTEKEPLPND
ncbi:sterile alpha motif domain-containing protein 9-like [Betta splendens]|uniref:Sterile alpha motif domain-containing protein 9-like n=1 Tax=Betta splendens TaxID=158456 RepID=A0A6P7LI94_BETSP|nr:sterile alpha motif domain-containing protein 9-like [Betta splendens]